MKNLLIFLLLFTGVVHAQFTAPLLNGERTFPGNRETWNFGTGVSNSGNSQRINFFTNGGFSWLDSSGVSFRSDKGSLYFNSLKNIYFAGNVFVNGTPYQSTVPTIASAQSTSKIVLEQPLEDAGGANLYGSSTVYRTNNGSQSWVQGYVIGTVGVPSATGGWPGGLALFTKPATNSPESASVERLRIDHRGYVGIGTISPESPFDINADRIRIRQNYTPKNSGDPYGLIGDQCHDDQYIYFKTAKGWLRIAGQTF